uniref:Uncharacterized protein n=1 Tax=Strongyloides venezuelensis TaxID=75913 RepID=A0A0K0G5D6_STRVS
MGWAPKINVLKKIRQGLSSQLHILFYRRPFASCSNSSEYTIKVAPKTLLSGGSRRPSVLPLFVADPILTVS